MRQGLAKGPKLAGAGLATAAAAAALLLLGAGQNGAAATRNRERWSTKAIGDYFSLTIAA